MFHSALFAVTTLSWLASISYAIPLKRASNTPVISQDFPDPSLIKAGDTWYAFGTQGNGQHIQLAKSNANDFNTWGIIPGKDALPTLPAWVNGSDPAVWAPDVVQLGADYNNRYLMYFSAQTNSAAGLHCVGAALSNTGVEGPYDDVLDSPIACPTGQGGAIDSSGFQDSDGTRYVVYKIDGNAIGSGGLCNNGGPDYKPTPLMLQKVGSDGVTLVDSPVQLLDRDAGDGPLIEAPSITRMANGKYVMYFSSSCYSTDFYDVTYATADAVAGPWTKYGPLFTTQNFGVTAPGGADIDADGTHMVFHAGPLGKRQMFIATVSVSGNTVSG